MDEVFLKIKSQLFNNKLIIYIKGTPDNPMCGFSARVIHILNSLDLEYSYVNVLENEDIRKALPLYSSWPTFPQVYYREKLIGGADIIVDLYNNNKLKDILTK